MLNPHLYYQNHIFKSEFFEYLKLDLDIDTVVTIMSSISLNNDLVYKKKAHKMVINIIKYLRSNNHLVDYSDIIALIRIHSGKNQCINTMYQLFKFKKVIRLKEYILEQTVISDEKSIIAFNFKHYVVSIVSRYDECHKIGKALRSCAVGEKHIKEIERGRCIRLMIKDRDDVVATIRIDQVTQEVYGYGFNYTQLSKDQLKEIVALFNSIVNQNKIALDSLVYITHGQRHNYHIFL